MLQNTWDFVWYVLQTRTIRRIIRTFMSMPGFFQAYVIAGTYRYAFAV